MADNIRKLTLFVDEQPYVWLRVALASANSLDENAFARVGWTAAHIEDSNFIDFDVVSLIRYCRKISVHTLYAIDTFDLLSAQSEIAVREFCVNLDGIAKGFWGLPPKDLDSPDFHWFSKVSSQVSLIIPTVSPIQFLIFRDAGGCTTILGPKAFIHFIVGRSKRNWWKGAPPAGISLISNRQPFVLG